MDVSDGMAAVMSIFFFLRLRTLFRSVKLFNPMVKEYFLLETIINDEREKPESPQNRKKLLEAGKSTNNKLNPHLEPDPSHIGRRRVFLSLHRKKA